MNDGRFEKEQYGGGALDGPVKVVRFHLLGVLEERKEGARIYRKTGWS